MISSDTKNELISKAYDSYSNIDVKLGKWIENGEVNSRRVQFEYWLHYVLYSIASSDSVVSEEERDLVLSISKYLNQQNELTSGYTRFWKYLTGRKNETVKKYFDGLTITPVNESEWAALRDDIKNICEALILIDGDKTSEEIEIYNQLFGTKKRVRSRKKNSSEKQINKAIIIGNVNYKSLSKLRCSRFDLGMMSDYLDKHDVDFWPYMDLMIESFRFSIKEFSRKCKSGDSVLIYYSGHGMCDGEQNYLVPIDYDIDKKTGYEDESMMSISELLDYFREDVNIIVVADACRTSDSKFEFIESKLRKNIYIAYSTQVGTTSSGSINGPSIFTDAWIRSLNENRDVDISMNGARKIMMKNHSKQLPMSISTLNDSVQL